MSTPAPDNDDLFRRRLEDYREMPSLKVWEGVEAALDQDKKKRRFFFWLWFAGGGSSLAAAWLLIPIVTGHTESYGKSYTSAVRHVAPTEIQAIRTQQHLLTNKENDRLRRAETKAHGRSYVPYTQLVPIPLPGASETQQVSEQVAMQPTKTASDHSDVSVTVATTTHAASVNEVPTVSGTVSPAADHASRIPFSPVSIPRSGTETVPTPLRDMPVALLSGAVPPPIKAMHLTPYIQPTFTVQGYAGAVAYRRGKKMYDATAPAVTEYTALKSADTLSSARKKFGVYGGAVVKVGLVINRHWYVNLGIGYETYYFADRYRFMIPGTVQSLSPQDTTGTGGSPIVGQDGPPPGFTTSTPFGDALIPLTESLPQGLANSPPPYLKMDGKLVYQLHQLVLPIDFGYRYSYKRFGIYVGGSAALHMPLAQKAVFYADSGPVRNVKLNPMTPFNVSLGVEPGIEYNFAKRFSLLAGGTFRYQLLNAYQSGQAARPYVLAGHLGLRVSL